MRIFCITLTLIFSLNPLTNAATIIFDLFEGAGGDGVEITATISDAPNNGVEIMLRNDSDISAVVTSFAFDTGDIIIMQPITSADWAVSNAITIPGASNIDFDTTFGFKALPPPTRNGINEGEELMIVLRDADLNELVQAMNSGTFRIAMHVQSIGDDAISSSYVTRVTPEPSVAMMLGLAGACMVLLRKK